MCDDKEQQHERIRQTPGLPDLHLQHEKTARDRGIRVLGRQIKTEILVRLLQLGIIQAC